MTTTPSDPHGGIRVAATGAPLPGAAGAVILIHGRGGSAEDILGLAGPLAAPGFAFLAPQAQGSTWYPNRFIAPLESNEPWLGSALAAVGRLLARVEAAGISAERTALVGFSQGACLVLDYALRHPRRYGALVAFSGGLIGPPGHVWPDAGGLAGTPVLIGCSDVDGHIPLARVQESTRILSERGGRVDERIYPGFGHAINADEVEAASRLLAEIG